MKHPDLNPIQLLNVQSLLWTLRNVTLNGRHRPRLQSVSTEIRSGVTAVVGDSGAGKSSLLNLLVGFERPDAGELECHYTPNAGQLAVYWLPPGDGLWGHLTVREHLEVVRPGPGPKTTSSMIDQLLQEFDLEPLQRARPDDLSQGERARLAMTRALASQAAVLVLDEPLIHTSLLRQPAYWAATRKFCAQLAISLVFASHDWETVAREADNLIQLDSGVVKYSGSVQQIEGQTTDAATKQVLDRIAMASNSRKPNAGQS